MFPLRSLVLGACFTLASGNLWSQEYTLKTKEDAQGDVARLDISNSFTMEVLVEIGGKTRKLSEIKSTETMVFTQTILSLRPGQRADEIRRVYETARIDEGEKKGSPLEMEGKKVLIQRKETGYEFRYEGGGPVEGGSADYLKNEFQTSDDLDEPDRLLRPKKPVKIGESWTLDMAVIAKNYARTTPVPLDQAKARGQGKLVKIYEKEGRTCGILEIEIEIPVKPGPLGTMNVAEGSKLTLKQTVDGSIDGKNGSQVFESRMSLDIVGEIDAGQGKKANGTMKGRGTFRAKQTDLPK